MKLQTIKNPNEITLSGYRVDADVVDGAIKGVSIYGCMTDDLLLRFAVDAYTFVVQRTAPPKMVKRHRVSGVVLDLPVSELFECVYKARDRVDLLTRAGGDVKLEENIEVPDPADAEIEADLPF